ncbi:MAG: RDD family protein [Alphaproteobacteria bacterium]|nr:RDD family protein [Alphaproteobacteria bacterium SS10]
MSTQFDTPDSAGLQARMASKKRGRRDVYPSTGKRAIAYTVDHLLLTMLSFLFAFLLNIFFPAPAFEMIPPALQITLDASGMPTSTIDRIPTQEEAMAMILEHWVAQLGNFQPLFWLSFLLPMIYFSMFTASRWQATPGMRWCKIMITDRHGNALSFGQAAWRTLAHFITFFTLGLGFFAANFNKRRLALHDWLSASEVRTFDAEFQAERTRRTEAAREEVMTAKAKAASTSTARNKATAKKPTSKSDQPAKKLRPTSAKTAPKGKASKRPSKPTE